ncbi:MAG: hypothetical protein L6422_08370 [Candidatus Marinimicrobia bacterium]|nr:hypothetical protein [bacterium]MCG2716282.1 hypothetical protein [Candidatus Neomarinimicrobiota bacterium]
MKKYTHAWLTFKAIDRIDLTPAGSGVTNINRIIPEGFNMINIRRSPVKERVSPRLNTGGV